ncbi:6-phosphogluconolactonase 1 [Euphorbia peplus]|nr:6-phosphogluconolactonase 1 [Euphorbia peplus]
MPYTEILTERGEVRVYEDLNDLKSDLAEYIGKVADSSYHERKSFALALSDDGVVGLFGKLYEAPYTRTLEWTKWSIFWADARRVNKEDLAQADFKQARLEFLHKIPVALSQVHYVKDSLSPSEAAEAYYRRIREFVKKRVISPSYISDNPKFDLIVLGMGSDGHVASLRPDHPQFDPSTTDWVTYLNDCHEFPPERVTFTLPVINAAANVAIVVTGEDKAEAVHLAIEDVAPDSDSPPMSARMVQPAEGKLVWFLDKAAASKLDCYTPPVNSSDKDIPVQSKQSSS